MLINWYLRRLNFSSPVHCYTYLHVVEGATVQSLLWRIPTINQCIKGVHKIQWPCKKKEEVESANVNCYRIQSALPDIKVVNTTSLFFASAINISPPVHHTNGYNHVADDHSALIVYTAHTNLGWSDGIEGLTTHTIRVSNNTSLTRDILGHHSNTVTQLS